LLRKFFLGAKEFKERAKRNAKKFLNWSGFLYNKKTKINKIYKILKTIVCQFKLQTIFCLGVILAIASGIILFGINLKNNNSSLFIKNREISFDDQFLFAGLNNTSQFSPNLCLVQENSLIGVSAPITVTPKVLGSLIGTASIPETNKEIVEYIVEDKDTLWSIAINFGVSLNTVLWANNLTKNSVIKPGQKLIIPPVTGVIHYVKKGDTISSIAKKYKVKKDEIIAFNEISKPGKIFIGDILIIPNGKIPANKLNYSQIAQVPVGSNYFICPIFPPCRITQGLHWYNAIDFSHKGISCGEPVLASAGGIIQKIGYHRIAGNYIRILHPNGVVTFYGHLSKIIVSVGQKVSQGQIIGYIGHTGYTIPTGPAGCHLHFEVRGAKNPFAK